ncbi:MAG TPA: hypothetical protein VFM69_15645 [Pricia sp.]|nr:hypothetical protein [Pricia sp.]
MKIRIKGDSVRFRLAQSEVAAFCETGYYEENTDFGDAIFKYALRMDETTDELLARFKTNTITLRVPQKMAADWDANNKVGFENTVLLGNGNELHLLLEKDFACLDDRGEDESDNYPNPKLME